MTDICVSIEGNTGLPEASSYAEVVIQADDFAQIRSVDIEVPSPIAVVSLIEQGPAGPQGPAGEDGYSLTFEWDQGPASALWVITHNLNKHPSVTVATSTGKIVTGDITYVDLNSLTVSFNAAFSGVAYCN